MMRGHGQQRGRQSCRHRAGRIWERSRAGRRPRGTARRGYKTCRETALAQPWHVSLTTPADVSHRVRWTTSLHSLVLPIHSPSIPPPQIITTRHRLSHGSPNHPQNRSFPPPTTTPTPPPPTHPTTPTPPTRSPRRSAMTKTCTPPYPSRPRSRPASAPPASPVDRHVPSPPSTLG